MDNSNLLSYYQNHTMFKVMKDEETGLYCVSYLHLGIDWDEPLNRMGRGLILDSEGNIVSRGYDKFFNYLELAEREDIDNKWLSDWDEGKTYVTPKIDGSMVLLGMYNHSLIISSSSSITNEYTKMFKELAKELGWYTNRTINFLGPLLQDYSLVFEYVSPKTQIVVPYQNTELRLHGIVKKTNGIALIPKYNERKLIADNLNVKALEVLHLSKEELLQLKETQEGIEGYVVQFENGKMLKIKTDWYTEAHMSVSFFFGRINTKKTVENVLEWLESGEIDDYIALANQREDKLRSRFLNYAVQLHTEALTVINKLTQALAKITPEEFLDKCTTRKGVAFNLSMNIIRGNHSKVERMKRELIKQDLEKWVENYIEGEN